MATVQQVQKMVDSARNDYLSHKKKLNDLLIEKALVVQYLTATPCYWKKCGGYHTGLPKCASAKSRASKNKGKDCGTKRDRYVALVFGGIINGQQLLVSQAGEVLEIRAAELDRMLEEGQILSNIQTNDELAQLVDARTTQYNLQTIGMAVIGLLIVYTVWKIMF